MLSHDEIDEAVAHFDVAEQQVRRDYFISHILGALSAELADRVLFFGGTALARGFLPDGRLSEDIDLIARGRRRDVAEAVESALASRLRRRFPGLHWDPPPTAVRDVHPAGLVTRDGVRVRVQILNQTGYAPWPSEFRDLVQRYADAPSARLDVPTLPAFAAWKTVAWNERHAPRDLYDLWSLAGIGAIDSRAALLFAHLGPTNRSPSQALFAHRPDEKSWHRELIGQTRLTLTAAEALSIVREAWAQASA